MTAFQPTFYRHSLHSLMSLGFALASCCAMTAAHAARPMITDDARTVDAKACQLESWTKFNRGSREFWALPACNFTGNLELTLGGARGDQDGSTGTTDVVMQGKTLFKQMETNGWGWGMAVGNVTHPNTRRNKSLAGDPYVYLPLSMSFRDDRSFLHLNGGWIRDKELRKDHATWGIGTETQLASSTWLIAETFGQSGNKASYQIGIRQWLIPNRLQIDTTYGNQMGQGSEGRWISIGLRFLSVPFLP